MHTIRQWLISLDFSLLTKIGGSVKGFVSYKMSLENLLPKKWIYGEKMPQPEGPNIEYKKAQRLPGAMLTSLPKYRDTLIGLLNVGGGYLVLGITNDGIIEGIDTVSEDEMDKFRVWVDMQYGTLHYLDGSRLDPLKTSLKVKVIPVENTMPVKNIVIVEAANTSDPLQIQTTGGEIIYRLNASNYKMSTEPIYRHRDVQGMVRTVQEQLQKIIQEQHQVMIAMRLKHQEEMDRVMRAEKEAVRNTIKQVSESLYRTYHPLPQAPPSMCSRLLRWVHYIR